MKCWHRLSRLPRSAVPSYERFTLIETDDGYAIWDDIRDEIYVDEEGVSEHFTSEWQAEDYLRQVRQETTDKEADEWLSVEQAKVEPLHRSFYLSAWSRLRKPLKRQALATMISA